MRTILNFLNLIAPIIGWICMVSTVVLMCWMAGNVRRKMKKEKRKPRKYDFYEGQLTDN
jgi:uncharacterized membrane protein